MNDPFQKLGIAPSSSVNAIRKAYRTLAKSCHPDLRDDKEAATIEFRELTKIYEIALTMAGKVAAPRPPPKPQPPPPPPPTGPLVETCNLMVDSFEMTLFGEIIRDIRVSPEILRYGGKIIVSLRVKGKDNEAFEFTVHPYTKSTQKFRFKHPIGLIEIMLVSGR